MDGPSHLEARVAWMAQRRGERPIAVFDLDNTVFDTRPRTLMVARRYDAERGTTWFSGLGLDGVRRDGRATMEAALGPAEVVEDFAAYWRVEFWRPEAFVHDAPIASVVAWVHAAHDVGAEVRFLTGRIEALRRPSLDALHRIGLPVPAEALTCKPGLGTRTAPWKAEVLIEWSGQAPLGWFLTEGRRDTAWIQRTVPTVPCVLLDCSFEDPTHAVAAGTPTLPRAF